MPCPLKGPRHPSYSRITVMLVLKEVLTHGLFRGLKVAAPTTAYHYVASNLLVGTLQKVELILCHLDAAMKSVVSSSIDFLYRMK
jgi:hypothetical protein